ncbi:glycosyl hydrolase family 8 [Candidatus Margulisiibacteriota bacterium]
MNERVAGINRAGKTRTRKTRVEITRRSFLAYAGAAAGAAATLPGWLGCGPVPDVGSLSDVALAQERFWAMYKDNFLETLPDNRGTIVVPPYSPFAKSEGMGHAMFFAVERGDWATFNSLIRGLSNFRKANGLLRWKINTDGSYPVEDENLFCATETEQNVINALLLAHERTGINRYLKMGRDHLAALWENATIDFQGLRLILPGDFTGNRYYPISSGEESLCQPGEDGLDCSYIYRVIWSTTHLSPANARRFALHHESRDWQRAADDWYTMASLVLATANEDPGRFRESEMNPMPDWVRLAPRWPNGIGVEEWHPESAEPDEKIMDTLRIPLYVAMDLSPAARAFLINFFQAVEPDGAIIGERSGRYPGGYNPGPEIAIAAYGAGLQAIGQDVTAYRQRVQILADGSFSQNGPEYYRDSICYYAYLLLNNMFPY